MQKDLQNKMATEEVVETKKTKKTEELAEFAFPKEGLVIHATSMEEARKQVEILSPKEID